ncbi:hypothetical protein [Nitrosomonas communis]|uniref:Uncharacterized protein n=1 Tax=Nitrosomonas communis TaxID=44574 RepID=A0A1I4NA78_9PROT|nr:hypothetical protein [Nitrosomonas communis]SFM12444.1 hypothetical protein SAMN05421863_10148 [Nitrosomonas communis]
MSNLTGCGSSNLPVSNFNTQDEGEMIGMAEGHMTPDSQVSINSNANLSEIIVGKNGAYVQSIIFRNYLGIASNKVIYVYGRGPQGLGSGCLKLTFNLSSGEKYDLSLMSSSPKYYNKKFLGTGNITAINWTTRG